MLHKNKELEHLVKNDKYEIDHFEILKKEVPVKGKKLEEVTDRGLSENTSAKFM